MKRHEAWSLLSGLRAGDEVTYTADGREHVLSVQRALHPGDSGGAFGSWDHAAVVVGFGPGRWNVSVSPAALEAGRCQLARTVQEGA